jgi:hypothetical protein
MSREYDEIINEYFDVTDTTTRKCLLTINEADQNQVLGSLAAKLYTIIVKNVCNIDFGDIPKSKGDITKIPNYLDITEALTTVRDLQINKKQSTAKIDQIFKAIDNMKDSKYIWEKAFAIECGMPIIFYNTMALGIVASTSLYISASVEFIKNPDTGTIDMELSKVAGNKSKDGILMRNIEEFNKSYAKGDVVKSMEPLLKSKRGVIEASLAKEAGVDEATVNDYIAKAISNGNVIEVLQTLWAAAPSNVRKGVATGAAIITAALLIKFAIPVLHHITAFLVNCKQSFSEYLAYESEIVKLNAERVNYNRAKSEEEKKKIIEKQLKIAEKLKSLSNTMAVKANKAENDANKDIDKDKNTKYKIDDIMDTIPDSAVFQ